MGDFDVTTLWKFSIMPREISFNFLVLISSIWPKSFLIFKSFVFLNIQGPKLALIVLIVFFLYPFFIVSPDSYQFFIASLKVGWPSHCLRLSMGSTLLNKSDCIFLILFRAPLTDKSLKLPNWIFCGCFPFGRYLKYQTLSPLDQILIFNHVVISLTK